MNQAKRKTNQPESVKQEAHLKSLMTITETHPLYQTIIKALTPKINALKNIHLNIVGLEEKFYEELHILECKYHRLFEPYFEQREKIVTGEYEPSGEETQWAYEQPENGESKDDSGTCNDVKDLIKDMEAKVDLNEDPEKSSYVGVPHFWLQVFKRADIIMEMIQEHDHDVILNMTNIKAVMNEGKPYGYTLEFHFKENEYFTNKVLTKSYELTCERDAEDPLSYDGPVMYKCNGCKINWKKDKDVTMRTVKKRQKHKSTGTVRVILKEEKQDSFFNFFDTPTSDGIRPSFRHLVYPDGLPVDLEDEDDEIAEDLCNADYEIGHFFKEFIVPKAVLYYTGDLIDQGEYEAEDYFPEEEESLVDDEDEDEDDEMEDEKEDDKVNP